MRHYDPYQCTQKMVPGDRLNTIHLHGLQDGAAFLAVRNLQRPVPSAQTKHVCPFLHTAQPSVGQECCTTATPEPAMGWTAVAAGPKDPHYQLRAGNGWTAAGAHRWLTAAVLRHGEPTSQPQGCLEAQPFGDEHICELQSTKPPVPLRCSA